MKSTFLLLFLLIFSINQQTFAQSASCEYIIGKNGDYECYLTIKKAEASTQINGNHIDGKTDDDVVSIFRGTGSFSTNFPASICDKFPNLKNIRLAAIGLEKIDENSFKNCKNLEYIDLDENKIKKLPKNVFASQSKLKILSLWRNKISLMPDGFSNSLANLELLNYNKYTLNSAHCDYTIGKKGEYECFLSLNNAELFTQISGNHLTNKTDDDVTSIYRGPGSFSNNFPSNICSKFKNVKNIRLPSIGLENINENSFKNCEKLEHLDLDENKIKKLSKNGFANQLKLKTLTMWKNPIEKLPKNFSDHLVSLELLNYHNNSLKSANCEYIIGSNGEYECYLTLNEAEIFTQIGGQHIDDKTDDDVVNVYRGPGSNSINFPSTLCDKFKNIKSIRLASVGIEKIDENSFKNCKNLEYLDLDENNIKKLPKNVFASQSKLKKLSLWRNPISESEKFSDPLVALEHLDSYNKTLKSASCEYSIDKKGKYECYLTLNNAGIFTQISGQHIENKTDDDVVSIYRGPGSNSINFPRAICEKFKNVKNIRLASIGLENIDDNSFRSCENLEHLDLDENKIKKLSKNVFEKQSKLKSLTLWKNPIDKLPLGFTYPLVSLELLNYNKNLLKGATCEYIIGNHGEYECYLTLNEADIFTQVGGQHIDDKTDDDVVSIFRGPDSYATNLRSNICNKFKNLKNIRLAAAGIENIEDSSFKNCKNLENLDLDENKIKKLSKNIFESQSKLKTLSLWNNPIKKVPDGIFDPLISLEFLNLGNYSLKSAGCEYVVGDNGDYECYLTLNDAEMLTQISGIHLKNKTDDDVTSIYRGSASNSVNFPSAVCEKFKNIKEIRIAGIGLEKIDVNSFRSCENLEYLDLDENNIASLPTNAFVNQLKLKTLTMWKNPIAQLPDDFFDSLINLEFLSFDNNTLPNLPPGIIRNLILLKDLGISGDSQAETLPAMNFNGTKGRNSKNIKFDEFPTKKEIQKLHDADEELDKKIQDVSTQTKNNQDFAKEIQQTILEMATKIEALTNNNVQMKAENQAVSNKIEALTNSNEQRKIENQNVNKKIANLIDENKELKEKIKKITANNEKQPEAESEFMESNDIIEDLKIENNNLKSEVGNMKTEMTKIQTEKEELAERVEALEGAYELMYEETQQVRKCCNKPIK